MSRMEQAFYADKHEGYFEGGGRLDIVDALATDPQQAVLEIGCGSGGLARAILTAGKAGRYTGFELFEEAAEQARGVIGEVIVGNVEQMDLSPWAGQFDALIASEVLEHLVDPWRVVTDLVGCLKSGGRVYASSPNVAHWRIVRNLIAGRFDYTPAGVMDRTHLRWFTPATYAAMFEAAGVEILEVRPVAPQSFKTKLILALSGGRLNHLMMVQTMIVGRKR